MDHNHYGLWQHTKVLERQQRQPKRQNATTHAYQRGTTVRMQATQTR